MATQPAALGGTLIIRAGPAGLAAARALREHGMPSTHVERHSAIRRLGDTDHPDSPMYESAHCLSRTPLAEFSGVRTPRGWVTPRP